MAGHEQGHGRTIDVQPERLERWLAGFAERHGPTTHEASAGRVEVVAEDGARAACEVPFPPLVVDEAAPYGGLPGHATRDRHVGVLLVRLGGHAAGVFRGTELVASKVGSRLVQGRSAAGGQSQKRFARRRELQARQARLQAAAVAARVLLPHLADLDAVVLGGDRRGVDEVLGDRRLAVLRPLVVPRFLDVPDPRQRVLVGTPRLFRSVRIDLVEPPAGLARPPYG
ncbi:MAG: acVLRF1 family peptidyl-tRNA hydrolase [Actinomycetes bacterium]